MTSLIIIILIIALAKTVKIILEQKDHLDGNFVDVIVVDDHSRPTAIRPDTETITSLYRFHLDLEQRAMFRYSAITDTQTTNAGETSICNWMDSVKQNTERRIGFRFREIKQFFGEIRHIVSEHWISNEDALLSGSEAFRTIAAEYNVFGSGTEKILVIYSGLFERSDLFDSASKADLALLHSDPSAIAKRFRNAYKIKKADNVDMTFVYDPIDKEDRQRFLQMVAVFKFVFKRKGADITIRSHANLSAI